MGTFIRKINSLPDQARLTARRLAAAGYPEGTWYYNPNHDLADPSMGVQVRGDKDRAPKHKVAQYAEILKDFSLRRDEHLFPPVVFTSDDHLIDGWTRTEAARRLGWLTFPGFVLLDSYSGADEARLDKFALTGGALNLDHGNNLSSADTERLVLNVSKGMDLTAPGAAVEIAKRLGISRSWVTNLLAARKAYERAEELSIDLSPRKAPTITRTHMAYLGNALEQGKLTRAVFKDLLELTRDAKLSTTAMPVLARRVFACSEEREKLALVSGERAGLASVIDGHSVRPNDAARLRQALGNITKYRTNPGLPVEDVPANTEMHERAIDDAIAVLYTIKSAQLKQNHDRAIAAQMG